MWLEHGRVVEIGEPDRVISQYLAAMSAKDSTYRRHEVESHALAARSRAVGARRKSSRPFRISTIATAMGARRLSASPCWMSTGSRCTCSSPRRASWCASACAQTRRCACPTSDSCCATSSASISPALNTAREGYELEPMQPGDIVTVDFYVDLPELYPASFSFSPAIADGPLDSLRDVRLDRQRRHAADEPLRRRNLRLHSSALPHRSERALAAFWRSPLAEFTGERVIPGEVDIDLFNEHMARYAFAARLARGKRALDAGCGAGYGSAELARAAQSVVGIDSAADAIEFARANYRAPNLTFEQASCGALPYADGSFDLIVAFEVIEHLPDWRAIPAGGAAHARAQRPVHRLHAQQALLRRNRAGRRERIPSTYTSSNSPNSATSCAMSSPTFRCSSKTTWRA